MPIRMTRGETLTGKSSVGAMKVGGGTTIKKIVSGAVNLDPASIPAATKGSVAFALEGAVAGDIVVMMPPLTLEATLLPVGVNVAGGTVTVYLYNPTGGAVDGASRAWHYLWLDMT